MRILAVAPYVPYEGILHAGGSYLLHHLEEMTRRGNQVTLVVPGTPAQLGNVRLAPKWLDVVMGPPVVEGRTPTRRLLDAAYRRAMNCPPSPTAESLRSVRRAGLTELASEVDIVELHWAEYARFASVLRRAHVRTPISIVEHDVELETARQRVRDHASGYRRWLGTLTAPLVRERERRGLVDADIVLVFKPADELIIRGAGITTLVRLIEPWLDEPTDPHPLRHLRRVLFVGALWRPANEGGLVWFLERVWPQIRQAEPEATLALVGASPSERLKEVARSVPGVDVVGEVPELMPYYESASVFVAPLFVRGGLKFKVPQAMLCGLPVVATHVAVEGISDVAPAGVLWAVTGDPNEMASSVVAAMRDEVAAAEVGQAASEWCREFFSFGASIARLIEAYSVLVNGTSRGLSPRSGANQPHVDRARD